MSSKESILVQKFGGTSVGSIERIQAIADKAIETKKNIENLIIIVSAMGKTTNTLVKLASEISPTPNPREYDALISTGENVSASLLAMAIQQKGHKAISLTGPQARIYTEDFHTKAKIININTDRINHELKQGNIVIITGFQGINESNDVTTIGRGGSDTSAVVLAAAMESKTCEIYTDVDGIYTTDPNKVKEAKKMDAISYDEMLELASLGAKVLHPRAVECAKQHQIELHVRSSFSNNEGTWVKEANTMEVNKAVTGITTNEEEAIISIINIQDKPGIAATIFKKLAAENINIDMIIQSVEKDNTNNISFSVNESELTKAQWVSEKITKELSGASIKVDNNIAKISIVGVGMLSRPGIAAKMFDCLAKENINIKRITTSEIKISCAIDKQHAQKALEKLHAEFELNQ